MADSTVKVVFIGDASKLKKELDGIDGSTSKAEGGFSKLGAAIGGAVAVGGAIELGKGAFDAAMESQKIAAQTEAVIKSTGGAAGVTAKQIGDLASALSMKNGVDDEAIQTAQNLLLTFTDVQNRVGEGNDIFDQSTQVMIDMAAAMGTDVAGGAVQLGKALNNPKEGISALTRVGVTFTDQQKKQIAAMQDAGDMAGAQKIILAELTKEFGGSAAAQATATDRMKIAFGNLQEAIGAKLIPVVERFSNWMVETGIPAMERFAGWIDENVIPVVQRMGEIIGEVIAAVAEWWDAHWEQIRDTATTIINGVRTVIETVLGLIEAFWRTWGGNITRIVEGMFNGMRDFIDGILRAIRGVIEVVTGLIHGDWQKVWDGIRDIVLGMFNALKGSVEELLAVIRGVIEAGMRLVAGVFDAAWSAITGAASGAWAKLKELVTGGVEDIYNAILALPGKIVSLAGWFVAAGANLGKSIVDGIISGVSGIASGALDFAQAFAKAVKDVVNTQIIDRINSALEFKISVPFGPDIHVNPPDIPRLAKGGIVTKPTLALIGESGPEAVVPLSKGGFGGNTIIINFDGPVTRADAPYIGDQAAQGVKRALAVSLRGAVA